MIKNIDKQQFIDYYRLHNNARTAEHFGISCNSVTQLSRKFEFIKSKEDIRNTAINTSREHYGCDNPSQSECIKTMITNTRKSNNSYGTSFGNNIKSLKSQEYFTELCNKLSKNELYRIYIEENNTYKYLLDKYHISGYMLDKLLRYYDIHKDKHISNKIGQKTKLNIYGNDNFNNWKKGHQTRAENYGSVEESYKQGVVNAQQTCMEKYGCMSAFSIDCESSRNKVFSKPNQHFEALLVRNDIPYVREFPLETKSFDFKIDNILVEINPTATHNSVWCPYGEHKGISTRYHLEKTQLAEKYGYRCIHVWEWDDQNKIIEMLKPRQKIYARNTVVRYIPSDICDNFVNYVHLQNTCKSSVRLGLFYNDLLVSVMTFGKPRYNNKFQYELIRYCTEYNVVGGAEKLFKFFIKNFTPTSIVSYCDKSKFEGTIYSRLGFVCASKGTPTAHWNNMTTKEHILDSTLRQRGFDQLFNTNFGKGTSNTDLIVSQGFLPVYDCGQARYEYYLV